MTARAQAGRPLKFFGLILSLWIISRIALSMPGARPPMTAPTTLAVAAPHVTPRWAMAAQAMAVLPPLPRRAAPLVRAAASPRTEPGMAIDLLDFIHFTVAFSNRHHGLDAEPGIRAPMLYPAPPPSFPPASTDRAPQTDRWRASAWMLWRPDRTNAATIASAGQLGASQVGARIDFDVAPTAAQRVAAYARVSRALVSPAQPEAAIGLSIQPSRRLPVSLALERRIALGDGARNAMAAMVVGGFGPTPVAPGLMAEGYAQAGVVGFKARDTFIDGRASLLRPIAGTPLTLGGTVSGGAQPHVHRVDVGPAVHLRLPIQPSAGRLMLEWRERIAGRAFPRSGLALTLAADF